MVDQLKEQIALVAKARSIAKGSQEAKQQAYSRWLEDNALLVAQEANDKTEVSTQETKLRDMVLANFVQTQDKHPDPNVSIREVDKLGYDPNLALSWAKEHQVALKLDTTIFEKLAKADPASVPFVTVNKLATATIATEIKLEGEE